MGPAVNMGRRLIHSWRRRGGNVRQVGCWRETFAPALSDLWLLAHPDLVELPALRAVIGFVTDSARKDRVRLRG